MKYYCFIVGIILLIFTIRIFVKKVKFLLLATRVEGTVIELVATSRISKGGSQDFYYPMVSFMHCNNTYEFVGEVGSSSKKSYKVDQKVKVYFDPVNPESAFIGNFFTFWFAPLALAVLSAGALTAAIQMQMEG